MPSELEDEDGDGILLAAVRQMHCGEKPCDHCVFDCFVFIECSIIIGMNVPTNVAASCWAYICIQCKT